MMIFNAYIMRISRKENAELYKTLFENWTNYDKWAPYFYKEFVRKYSIKVIAGVMTPCAVNVNDSLDQEFISWLNEKGINIKENKE
jgi:hypothetical protein